MSLAHLGTDERMIFDPVFAMPVVALKDLGPTTGDEAERELALIHELDFAG